MSGVLYSFFLWIKMIYFLSSPTEVNKKKWLSIISSRVWLWKIIPDLCSSEQPRLEKGASTEQMLKGPFDIRTSWDHCASLHTGLLTSNSHRITMQVHASTNAWAFWPCEHHTSSHTSSFMHSRTLRYAHVTKTFFLEYPTLVSYLVTSLKIMIWQPQGKHKLWALLDLELPRRIKGGYLLKS